MIKERRVKASKGVVIFSSFIILIGVISFLSIIISFFQLRLELQFKDNAPVLFSHLPNTTINLTAFWLSTVLSLVIYFCWIVAGVGTIQLKEWARQSLLISMGLYFLNKVIDIFINVSIIEEHSGQIPVLFLCIGIGFVLVLAISITYFFTLPSVVKQFTKSRRVPR